MREGGSREGEGRRERREIVKSMERERGREGWRVNIERL